MRNKKLKGAIVSVFGTQGDFADRMKISESVVSRVITGRWILTNIEKKHWAKVLKSTVGELFQKTLKA